MTTAVEVTVRQAASAEDFETIRVIRNAGREWMNDPREISSEQQAQFQKVYTWPIWLYEVDGQVVGYGLVRNACVSLAVAPEQRRRGIGTHIYRDLRTRWAGLLWALCREDNEPSIRAAKRAGFEEVGRAAGRVVLRAGPVS